AAPVSAAATVLRDARGVPHIEAASWQDAIFLQGYVTAQDRLWQMDTLRRFGGGTLSEVFGPAPLAADRLSRSMRMQAIADASVARLPDDQRAVLAEYARGVNFFIDTHRGDYSLEFSLPGHSYTPRPWTLADSILVSLVMFRDLTNSMDFEFAKGTLFALHADPAKMSVLFPASQGQYLRPGSNSWAVSGSNTADGKPILANDPHLAYGIPGTWHLVHLKAPGLNVSGAALPGIPCVITGHNEQIAWGVTNLQTDVLDLYGERLDLKTGRYLYEEKTEQAHLDHQIIRIRDTKPATLDVWVTRHGPVVLVEGRRSFSMRWSAAEGFGFPLLKLDEAHDWNEFRSALSEFWGPAQNFIYADRAGNIGYQAAGRVPIRRNFDGSMPVDGTSGHFEWDGYIPYEQMPSIYNPASGIVATANQNPFPPDFPYQVSGSFADKYRIEQIHALLDKKITAKSKLSVADMLEIQKDVYSAYDKFLAEQIVRLHPSKSEAERQAVDILRRWNGQMDKDQAAPFITELLNTELGANLPRLLLRAVAPKNTRATPAQPPKGARLVGFSLPHPRPQVIELLLRERPSGLVPNNDWDAYLLAAFHAALEQGRKLQGSPISGWRWGRALHWKFEHPVGKQIPLADYFFNLGPVEMSGSGTAVKQTTLTLGPSERMVVDLGNFDRSVQNLVTGESGAVVSSHYKDQWSAYYVGKSFPMEFEHIDAKDVLRVKPGSAFSGQTQ
ncbi:MAG TPA: penicillin acylase family protein, partial [Bryobacteraceae bacterium]